MGTDYDLNQYNVRFTRTPEFPQGTWAYFTCILEDGTPTFPYNISTRFFGIPSGSEQTNYPESVSIQFVGGPETEELATSITHDQGSFSISWKVIEGGTYQFQTSTDLRSWSSEAQLTHKATASSWNMVYQPASPNQKEFFRIIRTDLDDYDQTSFGGGNTTGGQGGNRPPPGQGNGRPPIRP